MKKIKFEKKIMPEVVSFIKENKDKKSLNFLNQHDIYQFHKEKLFRKALERPENINFIDGFLISKYLSIKKRKRVSRTTGPNLTRKIISTENTSGNKRHFFIGFEEDDLVELKKKYPHLKNINSYNPPYIKTLQFPKSEVKKIAEKINKFKADYVWVGVGSPKQNILSNDLFTLIEAQYLINIGAALDFLLDKKEEAPEIVRKMGIEWLYRLITDFKYTQKKVKKSFIALFYLPKYTDLK